MKVGTGSNFIGFQIEQLRVCVEGRCRKRASPKCHALHGRRVTTQTHRKSRSFGSYNFTFLVLGMSKSIDLIFKIVPGSMQMIPECAGDAFDGRVTLQGNAARYPPLPDNRPHDSGHRSCARQNEGVYSSNLTTIYNKDRQYAR